MDSVTLAWVFGGAWVGLVLLLCCFKVSGGRLVDILACECFRGSICDCWGNGGQIGQLDRELPYAASGFLRDGVYPGEQLPAIVIVNQTDRDESDSDESAGEREEARRGGRGEARVLDAALRSEAAGALLLRSRERTRESAFGPVVV